jgi:anti-anti-sigma factor
VLSVRVAGSGHEVTAVVNAPGRAAVVAVRGALDAAAANDLGAVLEEVQGAEALDVVVDLAGAQTVDSTALGTLVLAQKRLVAAGGALTVSRASRDARRVFDVTGLAGAFGLGDAA